MDTPATPSQIRDAFVEAVTHRPGREMPYRELWALLIEKGWVIRGGDPKRQQDAVYGALNAGAQIVKIRPGVFAAR